MLPNLGRRWGFLAILAAGLIISFHDVVFQGRSFLTTNFVAGTSPVKGSWGYDGIQRSAKECPVIDAMEPAWAHEPDARVARASVRRGEVPLWNPHIGGGIPFLAAMHNAVLFPPKWILLVSDAPWVWDGYILLRLLLAGIFTALYLRLMGLGRLASLSGAYAYMLCGFHVWNVNIMFVNAAVALPFLIYAAERVARASTAGSFLILTAAVAVEILSGAPETSAFVLIFGTAYLVYRALTLPERRRFVGRMGTAAGACLLGVGLSAPLWIPFLECLPYLFHGHVPGVGEISLPLRALPIIAAPDVLGGIHGRWDGSFANLDPGYAGTMVIILALTAVIGRVGWRRPWSFFAVAAILCILKYYGFPGFSWLVAKLPVFDRAHLTRWSSPVLFFSLAVLASAAVQRITDGELARLRTGALCILGGLLITFWGFFPEASLKGSLPVLIAGLLAPFLIAMAVLAVAEARRRGWISGIGAATCLFVLLAVDLYIPVPRTRCDRTDPFREAPYVRFIKEQEDLGRFRVWGRWKILLPNVASAYGLDDISIPSPLVPHRYLRWFQAMLGPGQHYASIILGHWVPDPDTDAMDLLNLRYVISPPDLPVGWEEGARSVVVPGNVPVGEVLPGREVGQTFMCTGEGLCAVGAFLAAYGRVNRGVLEFRLYEGTPAGDPIRIVRKRMEEVRGNVHNLFAFDPVVGSKGKVYAFSLSAADASPGNAITVWMHPEDRYADGQRLENGQSQPGDLGFSTYRSRPESRYRLVYDDEVLIFENRRCLPRAFVVPEARWVSDQEGAFAQMKAAAFDPREAVVLEGEPMPVEAGAAVWRADGSRARVTRYGANEVVISADAEAPGYLVLLDAFYPGWQATVEGKVRRIYAANGMFRAIRLETGEREVVFRYRPWSFTMGLWLATVSLAIVGGVTLGAAFRRRRARRAEASPDTGSRSP